MRIGEEGPKRARNTACPVTSTPAARGDRLESYPIRDATNRDRRFPDRNVDSNKRLRDRDGGLGSAPAGLVHIHNGKTDVFTNADGLAGRTCGKADRRMETHPRGAARQGRRGESSAGAKSGAPSDARTPSTTVVADFRVPGQCAATSGDLSGGSRATGSAAPSRTTVQCHQACRRLCRRRRLRGISRPQRREAARIAALKPRRQGAMSGSSRCGSIASAISRAVTRPLSSLLIIPNASRYARVAARRIITSSCRRAVPASVVAGPDFTGVPVRKRDDAGARSGRTHWRPRLAWRHRGACSPHGLRISNLRGGTAAGHVPRTRPADDPSSALVRVDRPLVSAARRWGSTTTTRPGRFSAASLALPRGLSATRASAGSGTSPAQRPARMRDHASASFRHPLPVRPPCSRKRRAHRSPALQDPLFTLWFLAFPDTARLVGVVVGDRVVLFDPIDRFDAREFH